MQRRRVRRDRHGRGLRGPLAPPTSPLTAPRAEQFGAVVVAAVDRLEPRWSPHLDAVDVEVLDVPPPVTGVVDVPLSTHRVGPRPRQVTVVVYRRPVLLRAAERAERATLVRDLVAEELSDALGLAPEDLDPGYAGDED
jgi:predicted Zn-dependent protease with MMP-like domain